MPRISSPRPLDLTKPFVTSTQGFGAQPIDVSEKLVTWYRDVRGDFVPDLSGNGNTGRARGHRRVSSEFEPVTTSDDTPEFKSIEHSIKSFGFSLGSDTFTISHITSVGTDGIPVAYDDHSFTDGSRDIPFSISFWLKLDAASGTQYIIGKASLSQSEWSIFLVASGIYVELSTGTSSHRVRAFKNSVLEASTWYHVAVTYDGSESVSGIKIYIDGDAQDGLGSSSLGTFEGMVKSSVPICLGTIFSNAEAGTVSTNDLNGLLHSVAIWKDRELTSTEIASLYSAYVHGPGGPAKSGFISRSPRLHLRELDDLPGSYPTVRRTGDPTRTGALASSFNDETSIMFSESGSVVFPSMLPKGSSFASQAVDIVGQESDVSASLPIRSFQQPNHLHYSPTEGVGPFNEGRTMSATDFFLSGTDPDILPGFTSPVRSKIKIEIDITPSNSVTLGRNVERRNTAEYQPTSPDNTGFYYYNFVSRDWEQIGATDPATGDSIYFDYAVSDLAGEASASFPNQFSFSNITAMAESASLGDIRRQLGYANIGTPTIAMGAPQLTKYHATSSQQLRMSDYILSPFLLEKISVYFDDVNAQRINGCYESHSTSFVSDVLKLKSGSIRDIDNYVFFLYRQSRSNELRDSIADVSGSTRYLVASGSMTFWNSASLSGSSLLHGPAFDYEFGMTANNSYAVGSFTGSISLNLNPAVASAQIIGISRLPDADGIGTKYARNAWPGGTSLANYQLRESVFGVQPYITASDIRAISTENAVIDPRPIRKIGGESSIISDIVESDFSSQNSSGVPQSNVSPYLLFPQDELVFGLEAGIGQPPGAWKSSAITGSFLRINSSVCRVILHGSSIKDGVEYPPSLNQNLSSNSVHEIIGAEPQLDQFQIEPISSYHGSYLDEIVTGSMATPIMGGVFFQTTDQDNSRRVISRVSQGQAGTTGSLQRFVKMSDRVERTYDSCLPDIFTFVSQSNIGLTGSDAKIGQGVFSDGLQEYLKFLPRQFPFTDDPTRFFDPEGELTLLRSDTTSGDDQVFAYRTLADAAAADPDDVSDARMRDLVFRVGWKITNRRSSLSPLPLAHRLQNAQDATLSERPFNSGTFRYGISNVDAEFTSSRWRYDRYGQFRDMLEPRQCVATSAGTRPIRIRFVSGSSLITDPTDTHSQNISVFATSSMPYFDDDIARNRSDNPDESLLAI